MTSIVSTEHLEELQNAIDALKASDTARALEVLHEILAKSPNTPEALHLLGLCSVLLGEAGRAMELIKSAHELDEECRDYVDALASLKAQSGDLNESLYYAKLATTLEQHPKLNELTPSSLQNYAGALASANISQLILNAQLFFARSMFSEAAEACEKELRINPASAKALRLLGMSLIEIGEHPRAEIALHAAEQIEPGDPQTMTALGRCQIMLGKNDDALACFEQAQALAEDEDKDKAFAIAQNIQALSFMDDAHWQTRGQMDDLFLAHAKAMEIEAMEGGDTTPAGKIRIGILSDSFYDCSNALPLIAFLKNYDRKRFEVFCLQQSITNDKVTDVFKSLCDSWRPVFDLDDWVLASIISGDGIQALIDTIGYGRGQRRATLVAKPAPLQVAWLNHLDGTGKEAINLILADAATVDTDRRTALDGQIVSELDSGLVAFNTFDFMSDVVPLPALEHDTITFGAYADLGRVSAHTARTWCQILKAVPKSLLVLNIAPNLPEEVRTQFAARFAHFGMTKRIAFLSNTPDPDEQKPRHPEDEFLAGVDILLDPSVNVDAAQVARALWMGIPVLTQDTGRRSGQVAASILKAAGKGEWVAASSDELVATAKSLTDDFKALDAVRQALRGDIKDTALFQERSLVREIETAIEMALEDKGIL